jgi:hypothetical protein
MTFFLASANGEARRPPMSVPGRHMGDGSHDPRAGVGDLLLGKR